MNTSALETRILNARRYDDPYWFDAKTRESHALNGVSRAALFMVPIGALGMTGLIFWDGLAALAGLLAAANAGVAAKHIVRAKDAARDAAQREDWIDTDLMASGARDSCCTRYCEH